MCIRDRALCDGNGIYCLPIAKDHKRVWDGDRGPMTGGMGVYSPVPFVDEGMKKKICTDILRQTFLGLKEDGIDYRGVIYAGLMLTAKGPKVLEYNVRFGDPEAQCVLPRLSGDIAGILSACSHGRLLDFLRENEMKVLDESAVTVVVASEGYPHRYTTGFVVEGIEQAENVSPGDVYKRQGSTWAGIGSQFPDELALGFNKAFTLRYGENPHQKAAYYEPIPVSYTHLDVYKRQVQR